MILAALIADTALVFGHLQDPETGTFTVTYLTEGAFAGSWRMAAVIISAVAVAGAAVLLTVRHMTGRREGKENDAT